MTITPHEPSPTPHETSPTGNPLGRPAPDTATAPAAAEKFGPNPLLADGVQMIGEYEGSGYKEAPSMVRRPDGQVIQLPDLLYRLAGKADGKRSYRQIADQLGAEIERRLDPEDVHFLVEQKLRPLGILAAADGSSPSAEKVDPFLAFRFRVGVVSEKTSEFLGGLFKPLFLPPVVLAAIAGLVAADYWLFAVHGVAQALRQSLLHPGIFLPMFAAVIIAAGLHEIGHAAACRYGGGHPGKMGCGLYLAWPAFYTDVTDAYRLSRRARLRTDLGGVYLNVIIILATVGAYFATRLEPLLLLVLIEHLEIVHQLLPVIRLDGYYIVADLTGVPDLFARIGPVLSSAIPGRRPDERVRVLKPWVRWAITAWVFVVVPLLIFELVTVLIHLPRIIATAASSADKLWHDTGKAIGAGHVLSGVSDVLQLVVLSIPILGIVLMLWRVAKQAASWTWTHTAGRPALRGMSGLAGAAILTLLALAWIPRHNYRSIQPHERGTVGEAIVAVRYLPEQPGQLDRRATANDLAPVRTTGTSIQATVPPVATTTSLYAGPRPSVTTTTANVTASTVTTRTVPPVTPVTPVTPVRPVRPVTPTTAPSTPPTT